MPLSDKQDTLLREAALHAPVAVTEAIYEAINELTALRATVAALEAANAKAFQVRGMCHYCKTTIYYRDAMADVDGKTFHPICELTNQIESLTAENARLAGVVEKATAVRKMADDRPSHVNECEVVFPSGASCNCGYDEWREALFAFDSTLAAAEAARAKGSP